MNDRLHKICFLPPPVDTPWRGPPPDTLGIEIIRHDNLPVQIELPLFWFEPPWHHVAARAADQIAVAVAELGVTVSALHSDLASPEHEPEFCMPIEIAPKQPTEQDEASTEGDAFRSRMLPYRAERYGFQPKDFVGTRVIDVRLSIVRDPQGHFGYSPKRIERWEATPADQPLAGGGWVPAASFLPDVPSLEHLPSKLEQLRQLAPQAAVFVSVGSHRLKDELPAILNGKPDGVILRLDDIQLSGLQLAEVTVIARHLINKSASPETPLWLVPGPISADDAVKLLALGASAIAVDDWCSEIIESVAQAHQSTSSVSGYKPIGVDHSIVQQVIEESVVPKLVRFKGLCTSMHSISTDQRLACLSRRWAKALGIPALALPGVADA